MDFSQLPLPLDTHFSDRIKTSVTSNDGDFAEVLEKLIKPDGWQLDLTGFGPSRKKSGKLNPPFSFSTVLILDVGRIKIIVN